MRLPIVSLVLNARCNCRCAMCDIWRGGSRTEMDPADLEGWLPDLKRLGVRRVVLTGGEPLLHTRLWDICAFLTDTGIGITLLTTGLLLERHAEQVARYCDDVIVSLDGPEQVHDRIRGVPGAFRRIAIGVAAVREVGAGVHISGRCTVQRANCAHLQATVEAARSIGLQRISFLAADTHSVAFNRPGAWDAERADEIGLSRSDLPALAAELDALVYQHARDFQQGFIAESPEKLRRRLLDYFRARLGDCDYPPLSCNAPWVSAVIEPDGDLRPCFFHPVTANARSASGFKAALNAQGAVAFRKQLNPASDPICRRCVCNLSLREEAV